MISAVIYPLGQPADDTLDSVVRQATADRLVPCNSKRGPFRIAFFPPAAIPANWRRMGVVSRPVNVRSA